MHCALALAFAVLQSQYPKEDCHVEMLVNCSFIKTFFCINGTSV